LTVISINCRNMLKFRQDGPKSKLLPGSLKGYQVIKKSYNN